MIKNFNRELLVVVGGRILQAIILVISLKLATYYLSPFEMGKYYVLASIATLFGIVLVSPVGQFINRKLHSWSKEGNILPILWYYNFYLIIVSLLSLPIIFLAKHYFGYIKEFNYFEVFWISALSIYLNSWIGTLIPSINMLGNKILFTNLNLINLAGGIIFSIILVMMFGKTGSSWYIGQYVLIQIVMTLVAFLFLKRHIYYSLSVKELDLRKNLAEMQSFSIPLMIATIFMWLLNDSYRFVVEKFLGLSALGEIAIGFGIAASIFGILESIFQQIIYPRFYQEIATDNCEQRTIACIRLIDFGLPLFAFISLYLSFSSPFIISILTSKGYERSALYLIFGIWIGFFKFSINLISVIAHSEYKTDNLIWPYVIASLLNIFGIYAGLSFFRSSVVIGPVLLFSNILAFLFLRYRLVKIVKFKFSLAQMLSVFIFSIPFSVELYFQSSLTLVKSVLIMGIFGLYFCAILVWKFKIENIFEGKNPITIRN